MAVVRRSIEHFDPTFFDRPFPLVVPDQGETALRQALLELTTDLTLMSVGAHPDDEDSGMLAYYRRKHGLRTMTLLATRGEGGQNRLGPELDAELGVLRFHETKNSSAVIGAEPYNLCLWDFGYSKSAEEAFQYWGHTEALRRFVRMIRLLRPDIIITNHPPEGWHGQHQAVGRLLEEAFEAAADPEVFPEHLTEGLTPWQVKKFYLRSFGEREKEEATVAINIGEYDPLRGCTYAEMALEALRQHRTQGVGRWNITKGPTYRYYKIVKSVFPTREQEASLLDGLSPRRIDGEGSQRAGELFRLWQRIEEAARKAMAAVSVSHQAVAEHLLPVLIQLRQLHEQGGWHPEELQEIQRKEARLQEAVLKALGVFLVPWSKMREVIPGRQFTVELSLFNGGTLPLENIQLGLQVPPAWQVNIEQEPFPRLLPQESIETTITVQVPSQQPFTIPHSKFIYEESFGKPLVEGKATFSVYEAALVLQEPLTLDIVPPASLTLLPAYPILPLPLQEGKRKKFLLKARYHDREPLNGKAHLALPAGWKATPVDPPFQLMWPGEELTQEFSLLPPSGLLPGTYEIWGELQADRSIPASEKLRIRAFPVSVASGLQVGIIQSYDHTLAEALRQLDVSFTLLDAQTLRQGDLSRYDTILVDIRAYLVREDLVANNRRLLEYVKQGGHLVVFYHKIWEWNEEHGHPQYAPYPLKLSRNRVTNQQAAIKLLHPSHPLFTFPNQLEASDWEGWVQERGLYFPESWAPEYTPLLETADPGEEPLQGGYLIASYGQGSYIYTCLAWYRQLRVGIPGGYRNFANMISFPRYRGV